MIANYFKLAFRNLLKRKGYSFLNILGLSIGITCCLLIFQYVAFERSYDSFSKKSRQIVRLRLDSYRQGQLAWKSATSYPAFGPTMKKDFPEVENFCRLIDANLLLSNEEKNVKFFEEKGYYADTSALSMFGIQLIKGNPGTALSDPDKLILSETMARKYFGNEDPIGKRLVNRDGNYTPTFEVTGVFKDFPKNSHLIINHLASYSSLGKQLRFYGDTSNATETAWGWYDFYTYLQLRPGTDLRKFEAKFPAFCAKYIDGLEWAKKNNIKTVISALPLKDIHLYSNYNQEAEVNGNGQSVSFLFLIAFFIICIAWINYINLATARSLERAKEVGVRKVMGAARKNLVIQFLIESIILNLIALTLAIVAAYLLTPWFNRLTGKEELIGFSLPANYWLGFAAMFIGGSLLAGIYPAFVLSAFRPVQVLKGLFKNSTGGLVLRKGLIITQFATSVVLIAGTMIVYQQVSFMRKQKIGADINQTLVLSGAGSITDSIYQNIFQPFRNDLLKIKGVKTVSASSGIMGKEIYWTNGAHRLGTANKGAMTLYNMGVDYDFIPSFGLELKAGRNFSKEFGTDEHAIILNEEAVRQLGFNDMKQVLTEKIFSAGDTVQVVGVLADYHHEGLQKAIDPMIFRLRPNSRNSYALKMETAGMGSSIAAIEKTWVKYFPNDPFNFYFLDESFDQQYKEDKRFGTAFGLFASLAILIACFGLLGLSAYNILQRTKEIGIRKVMGASIQNLLFILSKDFLKLVIIAFVIAVPVTWWLMYNWLQDFAYRINISWWVFIIAGLASVAVAVITISIQAIKAAMANPVKSLRTE
ncbi:ABC transporter permease [Pollutibacter soli]|uniref:ABC transporter permease n=1 Tax=Pollutibacter soli TaxID=3034157 RepID=UPI003013D9CD